jgi:hypothetical protein
MTYKLLGKALCGALIVLISLAAVGCGEPPSPTPAASATVENIPGNCTPTGTPSISIRPSRGKAGTRVSIVGGGFPIGCTVQVRLGTQEKGTTSEVYATAEVAQHGNVQASFIMPDRWPSGEAITFPEILIVVTTPDFLEKAVTPFAYEAFDTPGVTPTSENPVSQIDGCFVACEPIIKRASNHTNTYFGASQTNLAN